MAMALALPPRFLAPRLSLRGLTSLTTLPALSDLLADIVLRMAGAGAGGRKHNHARTRTRNQDRQKQLKPLRNFDHCQACGRVILPGHFCPYCLSYITTQFKAATRAGHDRPTLDDRGLFHAPPPADLDSLPKHRHAAYLKSTVAREAKWEKLKAEFEKEERTARRRVNLRRQQVGLPALSDPDAKPARATEQSTWERLKSRVSGAFSS